MSAWELFVVADDRTGALEAAGMCARGFGPVLVSGRPVDATVGGGGSSRAMVVDIASRHVASAEAGRRVADLSGVESARVAHKIDSTLRGNWAAELVAHSRARAGRRVLVIPSFPQVGRVCSGGVVLEHGVPVSAGPAARDVRSRVRSSRPADHLRWAGASDVIGLGDADAVARWLARGADGGEVFAVCDATTGADLDAIGRAWADAGGDVVLAGTAGAIGAAAMGLTGVVGVVAADVAVPIDAPVLVVCGSLHDMARTQIEMLMRAGAVVATAEGAHDLLLGSLRAGGIGVLSTSRPVSAEVSDHEAVASARRLASATAAMVEDGGVETLIILGGDTASAVLGPRPVLVGGNVSAGMPWSRRADGTGPLLITRAGGFGTAGSLVELLVELLVDTSRDTHA